MSAVSTDQNSTLIRNNIISQRIIRFGSVTFMLISFIFAFITFIYISTYYISIPFWDHWEWLSNYYRYGLHYCMLKLHNEHRLFVPSLFYATDQTLFSGRGSFLILASYLFQLCSGVLLVLPLWNSSFIPRTMAFTFAGFVAFTIPWLIQAENLFWPFQVCLIFSVTCTLLAFTMISRGYSRHATSVRSLPSELYLAAAIVLGFLSSFSFGFGMFTLPVCLLLLIKERVNYKISMITFLFIVLALALYANNYTTPGGSHSNPLQSLARPIELIEYVLIYIGSPLFHVMGGDIDIFKAFPGYIISFCGISIAIFMLFRSFLFISDVPSGSTTVYLGIMLFCLCTAFLTAAGRVNFSTTQALASRYSIISLLFWISLSAMCCMEVARYENHSKGVGCVIICFLLMLASTFVIPTHVSSALIWKQRSIEINAVALSLLLGVPDRDRIGKDVFPDPDFVIDTADLIAAKGKLSFFQSDMHLIGTQLDEHFGAGPDEGCRGHVDDATPYLSGTKVGVGLRGWAWDLGANQPARKILFSDANRTILGFGVTRLMRPDVAAVFNNRRMSESGWTGYAKVPANIKSELEIHAVIGDGATICRVSRSRDITVKQHLSP